MDKKSGFKECPRCGLRNRISTIKCDFCGYEFERQSQEWSDYVDILEKLSRREETPAVDDEVSRKIESTLVKNETAVHGEEDTREDSSEEFASASEEQVDEEGPEVVNFLDSMIQEGPEPEQVGSEGAVNEPEMEDLHEGEPSEEPEEIEEEVGDSKGIEEEVMEWPEEEGGSREVEESEEWGQIEPEEGVEEVPEMETGSESQEEMGEEAQVRPPEPYESSYHFPVEGMEGSTGPSMEDGSQEVQTELAVESEEAGPFLFLEKKTSLLIGGVGALVYLGVVSLAALGGLDTITGWTASVIGAFLMSVGFYGIYPSIFRRRARSGAER
ncbi:MAG: hypothetical protein ACLFS6_07905 [Methanomassiliicoccales archaeon]